MVWLQLVATSIILIAGSITGIILYNLRLKMGGMEAKANMPIVHNIARRQFSEGYTNGLMKKMILRKNGCYYVEFIPTDIDQLDKKEVPKLQSFIVHKDSVKVMGRGESSSRREEISFTARTKYDLPEKMRATLEGDYLSAEGQVGHILKTFGVAITNGDESMATAMRKYARGQATKNFMEQQLEENAKFLETQGKSQPQPTDDTK